MTPNTCHGLDVTRITHIECISATTHVCTRFGSSLRWSVEEGPAGLVISSHRWFVEEEPGTPVNEDAPASGAIGGVTAHATCRATEHGLGLAGGAHHPPHVWSSYVGVSMICRRLHVRGGGACGGTTPIAILFTNGTMRSFGSAAAASLVGGGSAWNVLIGIISTDVSACAPLG